MLKLHNFLPITPNFRANIHTTQINIIVTRYYTQARGLITPNRDPLKTLRYRLISFDWNIFGSGC